jgi:hypothetical protein
MPENRASAPETPNKTPTAFSSNPSAPAAPDPETMADAELRRGAPRSPEYRDGLVGILLAKLHHIPAECPHKEGTAAFDAYFSGVARGERLVQDLGGGPAGYSGAAPESARMPAAWYDLSVRVDSIEAVASCISRALPEIDRDPFRRAQLDQVDNLASAIIDLLSLAKADCQAMESQFRAIYGESVTKPAH